MQPAPAAHQRVVWAFWLAAGVAAAGGIAPLLLAGTSGRIAGVFFPFAVAAVALGACALLHHHGRPVATALYFVASLAIVYGILSMLAVPLRVAVVGTCPPLPARCSAGFEQPMTSAETTGLSFAVGMGIVAVLTGFFGLVTLFRRLAAPAAAPPVRRIAAVGARPAPEQASAAPPEPSAQSAEPAPEAAQAHEPAKVEPAANLDLPAAVEAPALPPPNPSNTLELPAHGPERKPRRRRAHRAPEDATPTDSDA